MFICIKGGGSQRLFRKIGSRSSVYSSESGVRKTGSYIYEDFMPTDGTDVKVTILKLQSLSDKDAYFFYDISINLCHFCNKQLILGVHCRTGLCPC